MAKKKKLKLRSKKNYLLWNIGYTLDSIDKRLIEIRDKEEKDCPDLQITKFEFKQAEKEKDLFSFQIEGKDGLRLDGQMSFWNCVLIFESLRKWK